MVKNETKNQNSKKYIRYEKKHKSIYEEINMETIEYYKELSDMNMREITAFHEDRIKTHADKPKAPVFEVSRSEPLKTDRIKSLQTYERRITNKIKAITDKGLWLNQDEIKLDRFKLPIKTVNLPQFQAIDNDNEMLEIYNIVGYQYEPVIDLTKLHDEYQKLISTKYDSSDLNKDVKKYRQNEAKKRSYYRLKAEKIEAVKKALNDEKWKKERLKTHISDSIIADYEKRINQKDVIPLLHKPLTAITKLNQHCLTTWELINDIKLFKECKTLLETSTVNTSGLRDWKKDYWNSQILEKGKITSLKHYFNRHK